MNGYEHGRARCIKVPHFRNDVRVSWYSKSPALGVSLGVQIPLEAVKIKGRAIRAWDARVDQLNGAVSLAKVQDLHTQMDYLVAEAKKIKGLDFHNDWKVLTILIGANNLCISCEDGRKDATPECFEAKYRAILERVRNEIPKVFVNAVPMFNISGVHAQQRTSDYCKLIKRVSNNECPCMGRRPRPRCHGRAQRALHSRHPQHCIRLRREELLGLCRCCAAVLPRPSRACVGVPERRGLLPPKVAPALLQRST